MRKDGIGILAWLATWALMAWSLTSCTSKTTPDLTGAGSVRFEATIATNGSPMPEAPIELTLMSADGAYHHTWEDITQVPLERYYIGNYRAIATCGPKGAEGYGCPCYADTVDFAIEQNAMKDVSLNLRLTQARIGVDFGRRLLSEYPGATATLHSFGHGYLEVTPERSDQLYLLPGATSVTVTVQDAQGRRLSLTPDIAFNTRRDEDYTVSIDLSDDGALTVACGQREATVALSQEMWDSPGPTIQSIGFTAGTTVHLTEGYPSEHELGMRVLSERPLASLNLTINCSTQQLAGITGQSDLLHPDASLPESGLKVETLDDNSYEIVFNDLIELVSVGQNSEITFTVEAIDISGRSSGPTTLAVSLQTVDVKVVEATDAVIGINLAWLTLETNVDEVQVGDFTLYIASGGHRTLLPLPESTTEGKSVRLFVKVPEGIQDIDINVAYMGNHKTSATIRRSVPRYTLEVDAFATTARVNINADTPEIGAALTKFARLRVNDSDVAILERDPQDCLLVCSGLDPATSYKLSSTIVEGQVPENATFVTESAQQIPDGDFEDAVKSIEYKNLASGGIYSSTSFPVYNHLNYVDIDVSMPKKYWASINAKTFCPTPNNANTWYMQPSSAIDLSDSASGSKSIRLTSVGWSITGGEIEPYVQKPGEFLEYSGNVPPIDKISAGYLFLGSYTFSASDLSEIINEGTAFEARPSSLNGYFKYSPDINYISDRGWAEVELIHDDKDGTQTVIARGRTAFSASPSFRAFNLPLTYVVYNLKATRVKIMFCSSVFSEGPGEDDVLVPVSAIVPEARFAGSTLWIDNLTFTY